VQLNKAIRFAITLGAAMPLAAALPLGAGGDGR
jgi:hypothetical protein